MVSTKDKEVVEGRGKKPRMAVFLLLFVAILLLAFTAYVRINGLGIEINKDLAKNVLGFIYD
ncbi:MAG: hypothetical protein GX754_09465, partial [Clostridiaceae bacterium]|nr:hypothetical protein [Clostridiaceae bacterium]